MILTKHRPYFEVISMPVAHLIVQKNSSLGCILTGHKDNQVVPVTAQL